MHSRPGYASASVRTARIPKLTVCVVLSARPCAGNRPVPERSRQSDEPVSMNTTRYRNRRTPQTLIPTVRIPVERMIDLTMPLITPPSRERTPESTAITQQMPIVR